MKDNVSLLGSNFPPFAALSGIAFLLVTVIILGLCTCLKASTNSKNEVQHRKKRQNKKRQTLTSSDVEKNVANGTVCNSERPKSHDRALPKIPDIDDDCDDEEEDTSGLYDVISKKTKQCSSDKVTNKGQTDENLAQNPYEVMPDDGPYDPVDKDSATRLEIPGQINSQGQLSSGSVQNPYELMPGETDPSEITETYAKPQKKVPSDNNHGSDVARAAADATVANAEDVLYAAPKKSKNPYETVKDVHCSSEQNSELRPDSRASGHDTVSLDTLDASVSSAPPVPTKHFDPDNERLNLSTASPDFGRQISLPGVSASGLARVDDNIAVMPPVSPNSVGPLTIQPTHGFEAVPTSESGKREPPYSKVTARESLQSLRRNHLTETSPAPALIIRQDINDVDYDQIDYDQIKTPVSSVEPPGGSADDAGSELYAEIGGSVPSSARNSTYAAVNEPDLALHAPTPPPVDILKQLAETGSSDAGPHASDVTAGPSRNIVVYATVDKSKNRHTISELDPSQLDMLYSKVDRHHASNSQRKSENLQMTTNRDLLPSSDRSTPIQVTSGYSTIGSSVLLSKNKRLENDYCVVDDESILTRDGSEIGSEYDPNYESVRNLNEPTHTVGKVKDSTTTETGVAREISAVICGQNDGVGVRDSYDKKPAWNKTGLIREHIYQEINDTKRNLKHKSKVQKEPKGNSKHSQKQPDNEGTSKPL